MKVVLFVLSLFIFACGNPVKVETVGKCGVACRDNGGIKWVCDDCFNHCVCNNGAGFYSSDLEKMSSDKTEVLK